MTDIRIKQGEALRMMFTFSDDSGVPIDLSAVTLASQVRDTSGNLVAALPVTVTGTTGVATVQVADTTQWPVGMLRADIRMLTAGLPVFSDTFAIQVNRAVTQ